MHPVRKSFTKDIILRLAGFLNDHALSKELSHVVESYATPAGSYKRIRRSIFGKSVQLSVQENSLFYNHKLTHL